jgi:hypothetical protein
MDTYEGLRDTALAKLRADVEAGWQQLEDGKVRDFDPDAIKRRGREKLAKLRKAKRGRT